MSENASSQNNQPRRYVSRGIAVVSLVTLLAMIFWMDSTCMLAPVAIVLLCVNLVLLYKNNEKWLAYLILITIGATLLGIISGSKIVQNIQAKIDANEVCLESADVVFIHFAAQDISQGTVIHDAMFVSARLPGEMAYESYFLDPDLIVGRVARIDIRKGTLLTNGLLVQLMPVPTHAKSD